MARQSIHNRRAGRGSTGGGASWISYSDMMAALLLIFVLILSYSLYQYFTMMEKKTQELEDQKVLLLTQQTELEEKESTLVIIRGELETKQLLLDEKQKELDATTASLKTQQATLDKLQLELGTQKTELDALKIVLAGKEAELKTSQDKLAEQQKALASQAKRIDDLIGVRSEIIADLSTALSQAQMKATVDPNTGNIVLDSAVFFDTARSEILPQGQELLNRFIPVYLNVLLDDKYSDFLGEIIIEGHTDSTGTYDNNLKLSQQRALQVALYCLNLPSLSAREKTRLQQILTAKGRSESDLKYDAYGNEDPEASRRVEFKFSLKDAEMITEMNRILQQNDL